MGTWPGNPPAVPDMCNVKPGDFDPEPNWRSMYEDLKRKYDELESKYDDLWSDWMECGSGS
jgi:hypothetical protein